MGCDIHSVAQIKKNGEWITVLKSVVNGRNYQTFSILANVRSGYREPKHYSNQPISMPKGFPQDFTVDENNIIELHPRTKSGESYDWYKDENDIVNAIERDLNNLEFFMGEHSFSHFYLPEINEYIHALEKIKVQKNGFLKEKEFIKLSLINEVPNNHDEYIEDSDTVLEMIEYFYLKKQNKLPKDKYYIKYSWFESLLDGSDLKQIQQTLANLTKEYDVKEEEVRLVFGFDS